MLKRDDIFAVDYAARLENRLYCFGSNESQGDEPDGVTFTGAGGGQGINISSDTISQKDARQGDTYAGQASQRFAGPQGSQSEMDALAMIDAGGGNTYAPQNVIANVGGLPTTGGDSYGNVGRGALPNARVTQRPINANNVSYNAPTSLLDVDLANQAAQVLASGGPGFPSLLGTPSDFVPYTPPKGTRVVELNPAPVGQGYGKEYFDQMEAIAGRRGNGLADTAAALAQKEQQEFDDIMASSAGVDRDSEVVSSLSDDFLDARGREDLNNLAQEASAYFNSPITKAIDAASSFTPMGLLNRAMTGNPSLTRTKAGLPAGRLGEMQIGVQQGGRVVYNDDGSAAYVEMPNGSQVGNQTQAMAGGFGDESMTPAPAENPMTGEQRCPEGFSFDPATNSCQPDAAPTAPSFTPGIYYRQTALDTAPVNTPAGFDFDAANRSFIESYGYRPQDYKTPMDLTGFTRLL